jgi:amino acid transporter
MILSQKTKQKPPKPFMTVFSLVMITVIAVDSLRSIPMSAQYGFSLVFYYLATAVVFLIPTGLVAAELASTWPKTGGLYIWIREAFGPHCGAFIILLQWIYNICWYPTILAVLAVTLVYPIVPQWADSPTYMLICILSIYWLTTWITLQGMESSALLSKITALLGTLLPMLLICVLGFQWLLRGHTPVITFTLKDFLPDFGNMNQWILLSSVLYSLVGIEISAYHAQEVHNPERNFPLALLYSTILILISLIGSSLAVAVILPQDVLQASLIKGLLEAFRLFFEELHLHWMMPLICACIVIGTFGSVGAWLIGPSRGVLIAAEDACLPAAFKKRNAKGAPQNILLFQGLIFSVLCCAYLFMPDVNSAFFILSILTAQLSLLSYVFMFAAVIRLRKKYPDIQRPFKIPGGTIGLWGIGLMGSLACLMTIGLSFLPPEGIITGSVLQYELLLMGSFVFLLFIAYFLPYRAIKKKRNRSN